MLCIYRIFANLLYKIPHLYDLIISKSQDMNYFQTLMIWSKFQHTIDHHATIFFDDHINSILLLWKVILISLHALYKLFSTMLRILIVMDKILSYICVKCLLYLSSYNHGKKLLCCVFVGHATLLILNIKLFLL